MKRGDIYRNRYGRLFPIFDREDETYVINDIVILKVLGEDVWWKQINIEQSIHEMKPYQDRIAYLTDKYYFVRESNVVKYMLDEK